MIKYALFLGALAFFSSCSQHQEKAIPQQVSAAQVLLGKMDVPEFDSQKAFAYLRAQTDFGPRNPNSVGHQKCLDYVAGELSHYCGKRNRGRILSITDTAVKS